jgi:hypothetical protein
MASPRLLAVASLVVSLAACTKTWTAEVTQPALLLRPNVELRTSLPLVIALRDMELGPWAITNTAYYVVVSRDRLRFHVTLRHKWDTMADLKNWSVYVEDAHGVRHYPEDETVHVAMISQLSYHGILYSLPEPIYRGVADLSIQDRDLFANSNQITLVLTNGAYEYRYHWISGEPDPEA